MIEYDVVVIGGGPAGLMAAGVAASKGVKVLVIEKNEVLGKKLLLTGGGRCNITNAEYDTRKFLSKFGKNNGALFSPLSIFGVKETIDYFNKLGLVTKVEPGQRVFPVSDNSEDVLEVLFKYAKKLGVEFLTSTEIDKIVELNGVKIIGYPNLASMLPMNASEGYAKNIYNFLSHLATKDGLKWEMEEEITKGTLICHQGGILRK